MAKNIQNSNTGDAPLPPENGSYTWVTTKEGSFWRRKRGSVKPAPVNNVLARNAEASKITGPAAKRVVDKLKPFLAGLEKGRLTVRVIGALRKALNQKGQIDFTFLEGLELQPDHPLQKLLVSQYKVEQNGSALVLRVPIEDGGVKRNSNLVSAFYFDAVVIQGEATEEDGLRVNSVQSEVYSFDKVTKECRLSLELPAGQGPWMLVLKISCMEGNEPAKHPKHYGMKVVKVG